MERLRSLVSTERGYRLAAELAPLHRFPGTDGWDRSITLLQRHLEQAGFVRIPPPPDGPAPAESPEAFYYILTEELPYAVWEPGPARLTVTGPSGFIVADTRRTPMALAAHSASTPAGGITTRLLDLGSGVLEQEYERQPVAGALVYGRGSLPALYRMAVLERGALGVVSAASARWHRIEQDPDRVAAGSVAPEGIGFMISEATANRLEQALAESGGVLPVEAVVAARRVEGRRLSTLVAEIRGREPGVADRVALIAPMTGPAPGMQDVSGAGALAEVAALLQQAYRQRVLPLPRRGILMIWGPTLEGGRHWGQHYPQAMEWLHSATVIQLVARAGPLDDQQGRGLIVERVPDPGARWTRPPDRRTMWGAAAPPSWTFEGHYLSGWTLELLRRAWGQDQDRQAAAYPYEGGSDHDIMLQQRIPGQRIWHFPDPCYRSSGDLPQRADPGAIGTAALTAAVLAHEVAVADPHGVGELLALVEQQARERLQILVDQAAATLEGYDVARARTDPDAPNIRLEEEILNQWKFWYLEALESVLGHPLGPEAGPLVNGVNRAIWRLEKEWDDRMRHLSLRPLPLPERFKRGTYGWVR